MDFGFPMNMTLLKTESILYYENIEYQLCFIQNDIDLPEIEIYEILYIGKKYHDFQKILSLENI